MIMASTAFAMSMAIAHGYPFPFWVVTTLMAVSAAVMTMMVLSMVIVPTMT